MPRTFCYLAVLSLFQAPTEGFSVFHTVLKTVSPLSASPGRLFRILFTTLFNQVQNARRQMSVGQYPDTKERPQARAQSLATISCLKENLHIHIHIHICIYIYKFGIYIYIYLLFLIYNIYIYA